jgi:hypothetical protein
MQIVPQVTQYNFEVVQNFVLGTETQSNTVHRWMPQSKSARVQSFILKQTYFSVINNNAIVSKYIDLRSSSVHQFQTVNSCLKMAKYGRNMQQLRWLECYFKLKRDFEQF